MQAIAVIPVLMPAVGNLVYGYDGVDLMPAILALLACPLNVTKTSLKCMLLIAALPALEPRGFSSPVKPTQAGRGSGSRLTKSGAKGQSPSDLAL